MLNNDDFIKRLEILFDFYGISASVFADRMGVQRSGLSHLMSGRNKPSLDFVMKITDNFPEVDLYWLLNGTGTFPKSENILAEKPKPVIPPVPTQHLAQENIPLDLFSTEKITPEADTAELQQDLNLEAKKRPEGDIVKVKNYEIERIVIFYRDGFYKSYNPQN